MDDFDTDSQCAYPDCDSGNKADSRCGRCRKAYYCSRRCQRKHWKDHKPSCEPVEEPQAGQDGADSSDLKEAHVKLRVEHEELEREHEKLKRHKRDRSLIYQAEIQKLQEALKDTEEEHQKALEEEAQAEQLAPAESSESSDGQPRERKHSRQRSVYYQEQLQKLQENLKEAEKEKDEAVAKAEMIAKDPNALPELQQSGHLADGYLDPATNKFTYAQLALGPKIDGVNNRKREEYLSDEEFKVIFKMAREEFVQKKEWQKQKQKRDLKLF